MPYIGDFDSSPLAGSPLRGLKRKRIVETQPENEHQASQAPALSPNPQAVPTSDAGFRIRLPPRLHPDTAFYPKELPTELTERYAHEKFLAIPGVRHNTNYGGSQSTSVILDDFCVYWMFADQRRHRHGLEIPEFVSLQDLFVYPKKGVFFDGYLCVADERVFVRQMPFEEVFIGNLEDPDEHTVGPDMWITSPCSKAQGINYQLGKATAAYSRFHDPFLWVADLVKHVADFMFSHEDVSIHDFKADFHRWLCVRHKGSPVFQRWLAEYRDTDFRRVVALHTKCLQAQIEGLDRKYNRHRLWKELSCDFIKARPPAGGQLPKTVVTPYVYKCFQNMRFGSMLQSVSPTHTHRQKFERQIQEKLRFTTRELGYSGARSINIQPGDVVAVPPDDAAVTSWKRNKEALWYFLVQEVKQDRRSRKIHGLWLYNSRHTTLSTGVYVYENELFLSNHCDWFPEEDVVDLVAVTFDSSGPLSTTRLFVRQSYNIDDCSFATIQTSQLKCSCQRQKRYDYVSGDTLLAKLGTGLLEPVVLQEDTRDRTEVAVRRLLKAREVDSEAPANELLYVNDTVTIPFKRIRGRCYIRVYLAAAKVPLPFSLGGVGNCFFIRSQWRNGKVHGLDTIPTDITQGFDPQGKVPNQLDGLDLFCGSGAFGHAVESGGGMRIKWAIDLNPIAVHSYHANTECPEDVAIHCESVDDFLKRALKGQKGSPRPGQVHCICSGAPCVGFSLANQDRDSLKSLKNISLIASTAAYIDFYRPKYALLENVVAMTATHKTTGENVFSQLLACFVGMGYQVQCFNLDACVSGAPQLRSRLIIVLCAPGLMPLEFPFSHCYPSDFTHRTLGKAPNGLPFGGRDLDAQRAFSCVNLAQAFADLPANPDGKAPSVPFPDHRPPHYEPYLVRQLISCVPRDFPTKASLFTAKRKGLVPQYLIDAHPDHWKNPLNQQKKSRAYGRVDGNHLVPTIMATFNPACAYRGRLVHWQENRALSVEEARRAQQFPREMVLLGTGDHRWRQIGNSVPTGLSAALGVALRSSVDANPSDAGPTHTPQNHHDGSTSMERDHEPLLPTWMDLSNQYDGAIAVRSSFAVVIPPSPFTTHEDDMDVRINKEISQYHESVEVDEETDPLSQHAATNPVYDVEAAEENVHGDLTDLYSRTASMPSGDSTSRQASSSTKTSHEQDLKEHKGAGNTDERIGSIA